MEQLREEGDLEDVLNVTRDSLRGAWEDVYTQVGRQVKLQVGCKSMDWPIVSFKRALQLLVHSSPHFKQLLAEAFRRQPCSQADPWSVVLYGDEIVPGNVLRPENRRKLMCWYASIKQLGPKCLQHEDLWVPLAVLRPEFVKGETGGFSVATSVLLSETFLHDELATAGVCLDLGVAGGSFATLFVHSRQPHCRCRWAQSDVVHQGSRREAAVSLLPQRRKRRRVAKGVTSAREHAMLGCKQVSSCARP